MGAAHLPEPSPDEFDDLGIAIPGSHRQPGKDRRVPPADIEVPLPTVSNADAVLADDVAIGDDTLPADADDSVIVIPPRSEIANRLVNVLVASAALVLLSPLLLLIAIAVKLTSTGPIFYTQVRVGLDRRRRGSMLDIDRRLQDVGGTPFTIYKFRTMVVDAERHGAVWATKNDPRVTSIGGFLRRTRLDELPQLWNVLRGDMNIVGPRPERPTIVARLRDHIAEYPLRQRAKPGITGWAQINQAYDSTVDDVRNKVRFDLEYLERQNLLFDTKIMLRTVPVMVFKRGSQ